MSFCSTGGDKRVLVMENTLKWYIHPEGLKEIKKCHGEAEENYRLHWTNEVPVL